MSSASPATSRLQAAFPRLSQLSQWIQILAMIGFWWLAQAAATALHFPIPGSVIGLLLLWFLLDRGFIRLAWVEQGANGLLRHLMLFFVPAMLALIDHPELLSLLGLKLIAAVLIGTITVMLGTALVVELGFRLRLRLRHASAD